MNPSPPIESGAGHDIAAGRLPASQYAADFSDLHPPLGVTAALVEAARCYFCFAAPCTRACPTGIDVPGFIRMIASGNDRGAARLIMRENIMGGTCARVCPTETLCEQACVRNEHDDRAVTIGLLQRFATDRLLVSGRPLFTRAAESGMRVAVVGAGPAGLACAHRLATLGHTVLVHEAREKSGGLNEYGLAAYKMTDHFARREVEYILGIGGIEIRNGVKLGGDVTVSGLLTEYDAVFLGMGLGGVNALGLQHEGSAGVLDAVDFIARLRQSADFGSVPVGRRVVVIGGGMTAVDIAVQTRLLGAEQVTIVYRRDRSVMKASMEEQALAQTKGVTIRHNARPHRLQTDAAGHVCAVEFESTVTDGSRVLVGTGEFFTLAADMVFRAIGQAFLSQDLKQNDAPVMRDGRIQVDEYRRTSIAGLWAGGDCVSGGEDLTVAAVQDGKVAAQSIHHSLRKRAQA